MRRLAAALGRDVGRLLVRVLPADALARARVAATHRGCEFRAWSCADGWYCGACRRSWGLDGRPLGRLRECCGTAEPGHHEAACLWRRNALHYACHRGEDGCAWAGCPLAGAVALGGLCFLGPLPACGEPGCTEAHP